MNDMIKNIEHYQQGQYGVYIGRIIKKQDYRTDQNGSPTQYIFNQMPRNDFFIKRISTTHFPCRIAVYNKAYQCKIKHPFGIGRFRMKYAFQGFPSDVKGSDEEHNTINQSPQKRKAGVAIGIFFIGSFL
mgnify:CR=1 FL=1